MGCPDSLVGTRGSREGCSRRAQATGAPWCWTMLVDCRMRSDCSDGRWLLADTATLSTRHLARCSMPRRLQAALRSLHNMEEEQHSRCCICLAAPPQEPAQVKECSCGHSYCLECLLQWCRTRRGPKCPLCQAEIKHIVCGGQEQDVPPPDRLEEEGPDLGCLDHAYFRAESDRLLCRARQAQMHIVRSAYGCGQQGSSAADDASDALQQVIDALSGYREDMQREVPFQPEAVLHELYSLESLVQSITSGGWAAAGAVGGGGLAAGAGGGGGMQGPAAPLAARFSADDAAAGLHEWADHSDDSGGYSEEEDGLDSRAWHRLERGISTTPGRRPPGGGGGGSQPRRRGSSGSLPASRSSGSLGRGRR